jgi:plasmid stabilization system protein ParE
MRRTIWSPQAAEDLTEALDYLVERNPQAAAKLAERVLALVDRLAEGELHGPAQTLGSGEVVHSWPLPPFRLYYQSDATTLCIVRLYHQRRRPISK